MSEVELSPEVRRFAEAMQTKLNENEGKKSGYHRLNPTYISMRIAQELEELDRAGEDALESEAADVANFLMMLTLTTRSQHPPSVLSACASRYVARSNLREMDPQERVHIDY